MPTLLISNKNHNIYDIPNFLACGMEGNKLSILDAKNLIPLPPSSELFTLPDRYPIGFNINNNTFEELHNYRPVAAFIPPGYTQLLTPAYNEHPNAKLLPLFSYTPVALHKNKYYVPAVRIDKRKVHDIRFMDMDTVRKNIKAFKGSKNRLIRHLINCALNYKCPNSLNFFLKRYECPLPSSPACNSKCAGCISFQPEDSCPSTQHRIAFIPTPDELSEIALLHIRNVRNPIVSFGQGCEGEPLLVTETINQAIKIIRKRTKKGTINMNTNGSLPYAVELLCKSGIDSFRVSINSVRENFYDRYYNPRGYSFKNVIKSIQTAKKHNKFVSLNYLSMPGFTDDKNEFTELIKFIRNTKIDMIQWRNLNYDPRRYFKILGIQNSKKIIGIKTVILRLNKLFPRLKHGYFNMPKESYQ